MKTQPSNAEIIKSLEIQVEELKKKFSIHKDNGELIKKIRDLQARIKYYTD
jgi:hypothetical protein